MIGGITIDEKGRTRVLIHYAYHSHERKDKSVVTACGVGGAKVHRTGEKSAVTCPLCKQTEAFKK